MFCENPKNIIIQEISILKTGYNQNVSIVPKFSVRSFVSNVYCPIILTTILNQIPNQKYGRGLGRSMCTSKIKTIWKFLFIIGILYCFSVRLDPNIWVKHTDKF